MKKKNSLIIECNQRVDLVEQDQSGVLTSPASNAKLDCGREDLHQVPVKVHKRDGDLEEFYNTDMAEVTFQIQCIRREQCNLIRNALDDIVGLALARHRYHRGGSINRETELLVEKVSAMLLDGALDDNPTMVEYMKSLLEVVCTSR